MTIDRNKICTILDKICESSCNTSIEKNIGSLATEEELNVVFSFLTFWGVIKEVNNEYQICSESAKLFIKSMAEFIRKDGVLIPVWDNRSHSNDQINETNVFVSSNFLALFEHARKKVLEDEFMPIKKETNVRAAIVRRAWGKSYVLMQYSDVVGKYQLIGGIVHTGDKSNKKALLRKLNEEIPELASYIDEQSIREIYKSEREDEEVFFSRKFGVFAKYKTYIFSVPFSQVSRKTLKTISENKSNRWVSLKEIEKGKSKDGKEIFVLAPNAIDQLKQLQPSILVARYDMDILLEKTWVKVLLAVAGISGLLSFFI